MIWQFSFILTWTGLSLRPLLPGEQSQRPQHQRRELRRGSWPPPPAECRFYKAFLRAFVLNFIPTIHFFQIIYSLVLDVGVMSEKVQ